MNISGLVFFYHDLSFYYIYFILSEWNQSDNHLSNTTQRWEKWPVLLQVGSLTTSGKRSDMILWNFRSWADSKSFGALSTSIPNVFLSAEKLSTQPSLSNHSTTQQNYVGLIEIYFDNMCFVTCHCPDLLSNWGAYTPSLSDDYAASSEIHSLQILQQLLMLPDTKLN